MANPDFEDLGDFEDAIAAPSQPAATRSSKRASRRSAKRSARTAAAAVSTSAGAAGTSWQSQLRNLTVYDAMLIASMVAISLAILLMFLELLSFEGIFYQWRTDTAFAPPVVPP